MKLALDRSGLLVASIPGVLPSWPAIEPDDVAIAIAIDADYRKRIVYAVLKFRAQQAPTTAPHDDT